MKQAPGSSGKIHRGVRLANWIKETAWTQKFSNPAGLIFMLLVSLLFAALIALKGVVAGAAILGLLLGPVILYAIVAIPPFGILLFLTLAYLLFFIMKTGINFPLGTLMDGFQALLILGFFIRQKAKPDWSVLKGPVATMMLIWIGYNIVQVANPSAESRLAWVYTIRSVAVVMLMYFVFVYQINTIKTIRMVFTLWLVLAVCGALYAYKQEFIGFSAAEDEWLHSDPLIADLLFIAGHWRKFSIFSDPVAFSYNMVVASVLSIGLLTNAKRFWQKAGFAFLIALFLSAMLFSGTRGAYVLPPAALALFLILKFSRAVLIASSIAGVFFLFLVLAPTSNPNIVRFQTAFKPSQDDSFKVRTNNQKRIQPYIWTHPMGGGLGSVGVWGQRFAPTSYLANFPPDSGYVRVAVELGWIGLLLFCTLMFAILREGINNYYSIQNPRLKAYCLSALMVVFVYNVGNYPQEALVQFPSNILFYMAVSIISITKRLDVKEIKRKEKSSADQTVAFALPMTQP